jgi:hypothetical protein
VSNARLAFRLRVCMRSTASHKTLLIILTVWGPYVALVVLMIQDPLLNRARYFWVACQVFYLVALFVMLVGFRNSNSRARWSDIHVATMCSVSGLPVFFMLFYPLEFWASSSQHSATFMILTNLFTVMGATLLRVGFASLSRNGLFFHRGRTPFRQVFFAFERDLSRRLWG